MCRLDSVKKDVVLTGRTKTWTSIEELKLHSHKMQCLLANPKQKTMKYRNKEKFQTNIRDYH